MPRQQRICDAGAVHGMSPSIANKSTTTLKLTLTEVAELRRKNQFFHYNDQYSYDHK
jgi:hypothetical protein